MYVRSQAMYALSVHGVADPDDRVSRFLDGGDVSREEFLDLEKTVSGFF